MHLAVAIVLLLVHALAFLLTPTGRSMVTTAWAWLKGLFAKMPASSPRGFEVVIRKESHRGDKFELFISTRAPSSNA
jgi:hypothetical protein